MSTDIKLSKEQLTKIIKSGEFLSAVSGKLAGPLMKIGIPLAKNFQAPLAIMTSASAIDGAICNFIEILLWHRFSPVNLLHIFQNTVSQEHFWGAASGIIKSLENSEILIDGVSKIVKHEIKKQEGGFLDNLLETLDASMLETMSTGKGVLRAGKGVVKAERRYNMDNIPQEVLNKIEEVQNKIPDVSGLVKKTDYDAKISDIEGKYFTTADYNKFTRDVLDIKIKQKKLVNKSNISNLVKNSDLNRKHIILVTKAVLKAEQHKIVKSKKFVIKFFWW